MSNTVRNVLRGIVPPIITPLHDNNSLDVNGLEKLIEHVLAGGVRGSFVLGITGEAPNLSDQLKRELVERTCRQIRGGVPIIVDIKPFAGFQIQEKQAIKRFLSELNALRKQNRTFGMSSI